MLLFTSALRQATGLLLMAVAAPIFGVLCLFLLPSRRLRIRLCNLFGHVVGRLVLRICSASVDDNIKSAMDASFPAIYVSNHTSPLDIFLGIWLSPYGVVGIAKKEVIYYPFFGQLYWVSGHLRIDRKDHGKAVEALKDTAEMVKAQNLGLWLWPEGTRSKDGRLLPFKKGFAHLAIATGLPVVPVVVTNAHRGWRKNSFIIEACRVGVQVLPPISTKGWSVATLDENVETVRQAFLAALPEDQRTLPA